MHVIKRDGRREDVSFDKVTSRIKKLCYGLTEVVDPTMLSQKVVQGIFAGERSAARSFLLCALALQSCLRPRARR
jgi:ribonucleoside-diphosphate reductase alpha chain